MYRGRDVGRGLECSLPFIDWDAGRGSPINGKEHRPRPRLQAAHFLCLRHARERKEM